MHSAALSRASLSSPITARAPAGVTNHIVRN